MNQEIAESKLVEICRECKKLKQEHSNLIPVLERDFCNGKALIAKQLELKKDYVKFLTNDNFVGYDKINSIHYCYIGCEHNIAKER